MASGGFRRKKSFLSNGSIKNLSTPLLLSASFISAIQAEAREGVPSPGVTDSPLSGATGLSPAFSGLGASSPRPTVPGHGAAIPGADVSAHVPAIPGHVPATPGPAGHGHGPVGPGHGAAIPGPAGPVRGAGIPGAVPAFSGLGDAIIAEADPGAAAAFSGHAAAVRAADAPTPGVAVPSDGAAGLGAGHSVGGGSEPLDSRSVVTSSSQGGNEKTTPVSVSSDEQIASSKEVLAQKETGSQGTSSPKDSQRCHPTMKSKETTLPQQWVTVLATTPRETNSKTLWKNNRKMTIH
ncbi:mucin-associated surface protein (MASP), putative, partial [Trypanosoma cruzi]